MTEIVLTISPNYVKHWGLWEAIREILQNAFDQGEYNIEYNDGKFTVESCGKLEKRTLILGDSGKGEGDRGRFGEGYKLALLVLTRMGHAVEVLTGNERWSCQIEKSEVFESDVLKVFIENIEIEDDDRTMFVIDGISEEQWEEISRNYLEDTETEWILDERGRIYVGGLFVTKIDKFQQGYAFSHLHVKLDRDRKMIQDFDVSYHASRLWAARRGNSAMTRSLLMSRAPDVEYLDNHLGDNDELTESLKVDFEREHGPNALPVSTEDEIRAAAAGGRRWILVPPMVRKLLGRVKDLFVAKKGTPVERLRILVTENRYRLGDSIVKELEDIIGVLS
jgi:hypothetical protein